MGAIKLPIEEAVGYVNNPSYVNRAIAIPVPPSSVSSKVATATLGTLEASTALTVGSRLISRLNPYLFGASLLYDVGSSIYNYLTEEEKEKLSEPEKEAIKQVEDYAKNFEYMKAKNDEKKTDLKTIENSVEYTSGQTLPSVLSQNAKALTQSVNSLNVTMAEQFTLLNNYMQGFAIYIQQFLDIKVQESDLNIDAMTYAKTPQKVKDWDENILADIAPREARLVKDATIAKDTTDKINFELPPELDGDLVSDNLDISGILGYEDGSDIFREFFTRMGGSAL